MHKNGLLELAIWKLPGSLRSPHCSFPWLISQEEEVQRGRSTVENKSNWGKELDWGEWADWQPGNGVNLPTVVRWGRAVEVEGCWQGSSRRRRRRASPALQILLSWNISNCCDWFQRKVFQNLNKPPVQTSPELIHFLFLVAKVVFNLNFGFK